MPKSRHLKVIKFLPLVFLLAACTPTAGTRPTKAPVGLVYLTPSSPLIRGAAMSPITASLAEGTAVTYSTLSLLPVGVSLDEKTGTFSGTPLVTGGFVIDVVASNAAGSVDATFGIDVADNANVWISGNSAKDLGPVCGTKGLPAPTNSPGGLAQSSSWNNNGNLWLFGGNASATQDYNTLWLFDGDQWTWYAGDCTPNSVDNYGTKGITLATNTPGARMGSATWVDANGIFWLFGGKQSVTGSAYADLWKFDGSFWTFVSGSSSLDAPGQYGTQGMPGLTNYPPARYGATTWVDASGNLWLYGGSSNTGVGFHDDLWKFDGAQWTWVGGSQGLAVAPTYGTKGMAASSNSPGSRAYAIGWTDNAGVFWLFGGLDSASTLTVPSVRADLWSFDGTQWTWIQGPNSANAPAVYGTQGTPNAANTPGARYLGTSWTSLITGALVLFGGSDASGGAHNDLWSFDGTNWSWLAGSQLTGQSGVYGTKRYGIRGNIPGGRKGAAAWVSPFHGEFLLFGGDDGNSSYFNDLWGIVP